MKIIFLSIIYFLFLPNLFFRAWANKELSASANFYNQPVLIAEDKRIIKLKTFLELKGSPLADYADSLISVADKYRLPWTLTAAIAGVETNFCKNSGLNTFNCWGWQNGKYYFNNFPEAIEIISKALRTKYYDRNLITLESIGHVYAADQNWAFKVGFFSRSIENFTSTDLLSLQFTL